MLLATTPIIEGKRITTYYGIVSGETIIGTVVKRIKLYNELIANAI